MMNQTKTCPDCSGAKKLEINGEQKEDTCKTCHGTGMVSDNRVADFLKETLSEMIGKTDTLKTLPYILDRIYQIYEIKLKEAYDSGYKDGKAETVSAPSDGN